MRLLVGGFLKDGQFITGKYSINQLLDLGVADAVSFGPQWIVNGVSRVTPTIDGDGSTTMIDNGELLLKTATNTAVGMRYLPIAWIVISNKKRNTPSKNGRCVSFLAPSEGIEPPFQEPESYVLSVAPRGHDWTVRIIIIV